MHIIDVHKLLECLHYVSFLTAVSCGNPPNVSNAFVSVSSGTTFGSQVLYACDIGFEKIAGQDVLLCHADRSWSANPVECQGIVCENLSNFIAYLQNLY